MQSPLNMNHSYERNTVIRYKGFLLIEQQNKSWLVRPERSPMYLLPFRAPRCSSLEVKKILDCKLAQKEESVKAA